MNVTVIGAGYVGMVQAVGLASLGHRVRLGEANPDRVAMIRAGESPIFEEGLSPLLRQVLDDGTLSVHSNNLDALSEADVIFVALPTPSAPDGSADLSAIGGLLAEIATHLPDGVVLVFKSTVPVGTVAKTQRELGDRVHVASNPEFLREGSAVSDFLHPDRIVIGVADTDAGEKLRKLYGAIEAPLVMTDPASAELAKYAANAYLATRVTFGNAIANLCEAVGADVKDVLDGIGHDHRIGRHFMRPGPGFGGSCFPKDTQALVKAAEQAGYDFALLKSVITENEAQRSRVLDKVRTAAGGELAGVPVAVWGAAYKGGTDDLRSSPALWLIQRMDAEGAAVTVFDPAATVDGITMAGSPLEAASGAAVLLVATEWDIFSTVDMTDVAAVMDGQWVIDARNMLDPAEVRGAGLRYRGIGR
jgi:UDPglucose 6-dehydrogenase